MMKKETLLRLKEMMKKEVGKDQTLFRDRKMFLIVYVIMPSIKLI